MSAVSPATHAIPASPWLTADECSIRWNAYEVMFECVFCHEQYDSLVLI